MAGSSTGLLNGETGKEPECDGGAAREDWVKSEETEAEMDFAFFDSPADAEDEEPWSLLEWRKRFLKDMEDEKDQGLNPA